jgi:hypothetical protein
MLENANITVLNRDNLRFIDERQRFLQRQFTYGRFDSGGRLKGGFWLNMHKQERFERIKINGESVVELDYKAMLPHLMYAKVGSHVPAGDPYIISGLSPQSREGVKKLFAALTFDLNNNRSQFPKKAGHLFNKTDHAKGCRYVIEAIRHQHKAVSHLFGLGAGHQFQFNESELMVALLLRLREWGFIGLPIHDCLLAPRSQAFDVQNLMEQVALDVLKIEVSVSRMEGPGR